MSVEKILGLSVKNYIQATYASEVSDSQIQVQKTRPEFEGDVTIVVFPFTKLTKKGPEQTAQELGVELSKLPVVEKFNVVKGFLNLTINKKYWLALFEKTYSLENFGFAKPNSTGKTIMVEYSSPNTNKPLHLGHIRNNALGFAVSQILKANGHNVIKTQIINDRGIHICKSMIAWQKFGNGETPTTSGLKGDKLVGKYYVRFEQEYQKQIQELLNEGMIIDHAKKEAPIMREAHEMLVKWEAKDKEVHELWKTMNNWVYLGFNETYLKLGVDFDKLYYESETYLTGKDVVNEGIEKGVFAKKEDGSVWVDLTADGLDEKIVLRSDGTAVYMTQDIGTAILRNQDYNGLDSIIYTVGNEQDYHFKVLFLILKKLGYPFAENCSHLSYGMVDLPDGKMKSREGTVVDADDLIDDMIATATTTAEELGKLEGIEDSEKRDIYRKIGLGALKYFILKVDPKKRILFDPKESIDFHGNTGPFIQYTYARIQALKRKAGEIKLDIEPFEMGDKEKEIIKLIGDYPAVVKEAGTQSNPALIANYVYDLVKEFNSFYQAVPILKGDQPKILDFRVAVSVMVGRIIESGMNLLGIEMPERM